MTTGELIKDIRLEKGFTQKELGNLCGIDEAQLRKYECGRVQAKTPTLAKIATALSVPLLYLLPDADGELSAEVKEQAKSQYLKLLDQNLSRIFAQIIKLNFDELSSLADIAEALEPSEFYGFAKVGYGASMNGITPFMVQEATMQTEWDKSKPRHFNKRKWSVI